MEYGKILEIKKGLKILIDLLNHKGEERISLTKTELMEYLEAIESLEIQKNELLSALKTRIADDLAAGADSAEYLETTIYKVLEEVFNVKCVPVDVEANITVMILDAEEYFNLGNLGYPEEFEEGLPHKKYEFNSPKEFVEHWYGMEGDWYWVFHLGELICSGAIDPSDIEIFEEHFGEEFISPDEIEEVKECIESMLEDFDLGGVEITDEDYKSILKKVSDSDELNPLEEIVKEHLRGIREVLDDGLAESLPKSVVFTASELAVDTDSVYEDKEWLSEIIGNRLSNTYGFCHEGFDLDVTYNEFKEPSEVVVSNIKWDTTE